MNKMKGASNQQLRDRIAELENTVHLLRRLVEDWLPQIGMTIGFREMFYQIVGEPYPSWFSVPELGFCEQKWIEDNDLTAEGEENG